MTLAQRKPSRAVQHKIANRVTGKMTERERESQRDGQRKNVSVVLRDIVRHRKGLCVYLEVSPLQVQELGAADVVADEGVFVLPQAELLQPGGHLLSAPPLNYTSTEREAPFSVQPPYTRRTQANRVRPRGGTSQKQPQKEKGTKNQTGKRRHREKWRQQLAKRGLNRFGLVTGTPRGVSGMQVITVARPPLSH